MSIDRVSGAGGGVDRFVEDDEAIPSDTEVFSSNAEPQENASTLGLEGDIGAQVAALTILSAHRQRDANRDIQLAEEAALERAEDAQVGALREKADAIRAAGLADGTAGMASGLLTMGGTWSQQESEKLLYQGGAKVSDGAGKALGGLYRADQADQEASATQHEHEAAHHRRNLDAARDAVRESQDLLQRALDFYKQSQHGAADATNSSVRRG